MAVEIALLAPWDSRGWKAKIRDRERLEPPHVTVLYKTSAWRFDLRTKAFLDKEPSPTDVAEEVIGAVRSNLTLLRQEWDRMYPTNRISSTERKDGRKGKSRDE